MQPWWQAASSQTWISGPRSKSLWSTYLQCFLCSDSPISIHTYVHTYMHAYMQMCIHMCVCVDALFSFLETESERTTCIRIRTLITIILSRTSWVISSPLLCTQSHMSSISLCTPWRRHGREVFDQIKGVQTM